MIFEITVYRMGIFFAILAVGFMCGKLNILRNEYMPDFAKLITKVFLPVLMFESVVAGSTRQTIIDNWLVIVLAAVFYLVVLAVLFLLARIMRLDRGHSRVYAFCFAFGNIGFIGIPLLSALFPNYGLLFIALFSIIDQPLFWTYGVRLASGASQPGKVSLRSLISPNTVALALGLVAVLLGVQLPDLASDVLKTLSNATSALCMMYLGALLCFSNWVPALKRKELYVGVAVKMILLPILAGRLMMAVGLPEEMMICMVVIMSLPVMTVVPMVVKSNGGDADYASGIAMATMVISIATIPVVQLLAFM